MSPKDVIFYNEQPHFDDGLLAAMHLIKVLALAGYKIVSSCATKGWDNVYSDDALGLLEVAGELDDDVLESLDYGQREGLLKQWGDLIGGYSPPPDGDHEVLPYIQEKVKEILKDILAFGRECSDEWYAHQKATGMPMLDEQAQRICDLFTPQEKPPVLSEEDIDKEKRRFHELAT